jgi:hypothetical protein
VAKCLVFQVVLLLRKKRSFFFKADKSKMVDCVTVSASDFALRASDFALRASDFALRATTGQDDGTRQPNILKQPLAQKVHIRITRAGFVVNIKFFAGIAISD